MLLFLIILAREPDCFDHPSTMGSHYVPIVLNRLFLGRTKNNRHFGYPETKITDFKISGTRLGTTLHHCCLILETETEPGMKSCFHYLCPAVVCLANISNNSNALSDGLRIVSKIKELHLSM